ncbi:MAG TPA: hypothetical protein VFA65_19520, partial [Bryobacteraceae bacterium]|nr:hypothetical protein [Bryobacteraceae bacterium]
RRGTGSKQGPGPHDTAAFGQQRDSAGAGRSPPADAALVAAGRAQGRRRHEAVRSAGTHSEHLQELLRGPARVQLAAARAQAAAGIQHAVRRANERSVSDEYPRKQIAAVAV